MSTTTNPVTGSWSKALELAISRSGCQDPPQITEKDSLPDPGSWSEEIDLAFYAESSMTIPGKGEPGSGCGEWGPKAFCDECGEPQFGRSRCDQRGCSSDWGSWSRRRAEKVTERLAAARHLADDNLDKRAIHAVFSPPEGSIRSLTGVQRGYNDAYDLAKEQGVRGGVAIFHGFRLTGEAVQLFSEATGRGEWEGKKWKFVREHDRNWRSLVYWSPHYHIVGLSRDFKANKPDEQGGWVAKRIRSLEPFNLTRSKGYEDMIGLTMYQLSHATFETRSSSDCIRWFGDLATNQFSPKNELSSGVLDVIKRMVKETGENDPDGEDENDPLLSLEKDDGCVNCGSVAQSPIWKAGRMLQDQRWCAQIGIKQQRKLTVAFEWAIGERKPPPGLKHPQSEDDAREAFEAML